MSKKSALGSVMQQSILPQMQQMQEQTVATIIQAIQNIPQPQGGGGIDPMVIQQVMGAINRIQMPDITPVVATLGALAEHIDALPTLEDRPNEWTFDVERDPQTHFITSVKVTPA